MRNFVEGLKSKYGDSLNNKEVFNRATQEINDKAMDLSNSHIRDLNLGYGGLAAAGALGLGGKYLLDKRKRERDEEKKNSK